MDLIRPKAEELTLLDEQRKQWDAKVAQVMQEKYVSDRKPLSFSNGYPCS